MKMGWTARIPLEKGLEDTYEWFLANPKKYLTELEERVDETTA